MLIRYKKNYEKIAMGLMSFMPTEKELKHLQQTMKEYEENDKWQLFLWKDEDLIGVVGIIEEENHIELQHISVNPSHRNQGIGKKMVCALRDLYPNVPIKATEHTAAFIDRCNLDE